MAGLAQAQYLRTGATALVSDASGFDTKRNETDWTLSTGVPISQSATASTGSGFANANFTAGFGLLKGLTQSSSSFNAGLRAVAQSNGTFAGFNSFIGAGFNDKITVSGAGAVVVTINYKLHSNQTSGGGAGASTQAALDVFSYGSTFTGQVGGGKIQFDGDGNRTGTRSYSLTLQNGDSFFVQGELAAYSFVTLNSTNPYGDYFATTDATNTGSITITASGGTFSSASGASYAPVPEPGSLSLMLLGAGWVARRRKLRT